MTPVCVANMRPGKEIESRSDSTGTEKALAHRSKRLKPEFGEIGPQQNAKALLPFPWDDAIAAGLGILRLPPAVFWAMTPRELGLAMRGAAGISALAPSLARADLAALMQRFPDGLPG